MRPDIARQRAYHFALGLLAGRPAEADKRLPPVRQLAVMAGVSLVTMWKALKQLRQKDRAGAGARPAVRDTAPKGRRSDQITEQLAEDILKGVYAPGNLLPSAKELAAQHGACYRTVRVALGRLQEQGSVVAHKRGFSVAQLSSSQPSSVVVLVARGDAAGNLHLLSSRTHEHLQALERECGRAGVALAIAPYNHATGRLWDSALLTKRQPAGPTRIGFIVWQIGIPEQRLTDLVLQLAPLRLPIAVLDEDGEARLPAMGNLRERVKVFAMAHTLRAGREAGGFLRGLGHRRIAYISPGHEWLWSRNRLEGLRQAFSQSGGDEQAVSAFTLEGYGELLELVERGRNIQRNVTSLLASGLRRVAGRRTGLVSTVNALQRQIERVVRSESYHARLESLLERALSDKTITAWVAANDDVALQCLEFLANKGRSVPSQVSVLGFDDSLEVFFQKVTSYNFNGAALMRAMLAHLLDTRPRRGVRDVGPVEVPGFVTARRTTGRASR
jgi:DNA-binding LacI/PurR family transcriptional regulator